jgi:hypothetical protein
MINIRPYPLSLIPYPRVSAVVVLLVLIFSSCEKEITIDNLPQPKDKLVVEGHIEPGQTPFVYLSKNAAYFAPTDLNSLSQYVIHNAFVTITDGFTTDTLTEVVPGFGYYYRADNMLGVAGRSYALTIVAEGKTYTAATTIPPPVPLDSLWFRVEGTLDSLGFVWAHLDEPAGLGQAYRWMAMRIGKDDDFIPPLGSAFDDKFIDGKSFDFAFNRGEVPNSDAIDDNNQESGYFKTGDVVVVKFSSIDHAAFEFYRSFEAEIASNGNPFASPSTVKTNVLPEGEALGVFCGYGAWVDTLVLNP